MPWFVVNGDDKKRALLNCLHHLLSLIPNSKMKYEKIELPPIPEYINYVRPPMDYQTFIPEIF